MKDLTKNIDTIASNGYIVERGSRFWMLSSESNIQGVIGLTSVLTTKKTYAKAADAIKYGRVLYGKG